MRLTEHPVVCCEISSIFCCIGPDGAGQTDGFDGNQLPDCLPKSGGVVLEEGKETPVIELTVDYYQQQHQTNLTLSLKQYISSPNWPLVWSDFGLCWLPCTPCCSFASGKSKTLIPF